MNWLKQEKDDEWLKPWQQKALQNGRVPLPESRGYRPWVPTTKKVKLIQQPAASLHRALPMKSTGLAKSQWSKSEIYLLVELRLKSMPWGDIQLRFPHRSIVAIKQTWWKYRAALGPVSRNIRHTSTRNKS